MRAEQSSLTASGIAIIRALESEKPADERICYDPYARRMVSKFLFQLVRFFVWLGYSEMRGPGVMGYLVARERYIDDYLRVCLAEGIDQVVILGAGYDARAYRFNGLKGKVKIFEVDLPATQATKLARLKEIFGELPAHVVFVPIDFDTQTLAQCLLESGYLEDQKTLFIWQGVTQYLTPEGVDSTLSFISHHSGAKSSVIFDYMYTSLLDGTVKRYEVKKMLNDRWLSRESFKFGIPEGTTENFLEQRGFTDIRNVDGIYLHDTYFTGKNKRRRVTDGYAIVSATVTRGSAV